MSVPFPHPSPRELTDHAARRLPATDVLRISDHLAACGDCQDAFARLRRSAEREPGCFITEPADGTPDFDILADELDGTLGAERHEELAAELARSPAAREALADLAAFRAELASLPSKHHGPDSLPVVRSKHGGVNKVVAAPLWRWQTAASWSTGLAALFVALVVGRWVFIRHSQGPEDLLRGAGGQAAELAGLPAELRVSIDTAARTGELPPMRSPLATRRESLAGHVAAVELTAASPVGTVIRERRPALQWTSLEQATGYLVSYSTADGGPLVTSPVLPATQTQWVPPEALQRGATYQWQVEALRGEAVIDRAPKPPAGEARFQVLDSAGNDELEKIEKADGAYPLVLGVAYWRAGLAAAAADQFHRLSREHAQSDIARRLERAAIAVAAPPAAPAVAP